MKQMMLMTCYVIKKRKEEVTSEVHVDFKRRERKSHVRQGFGWELTGADALLEGRHTVPYISLRLVMSPVLY